MKSYLAIYKVYPVDYVDRGYLNSSTGFYQSDSSETRLHRFEAQNNSTAKRMAKVELNEIKRGMETVLGKVKITLVGGKKIKPPQLEELLEVMPVK